MHTDRKIGFAMGILLIGIVAALFFRNETLVDTSVPAVRRERELNARLRERDVAVYLNDEKQAPEQTADAVDEQPWTLRDVLKNMGARNKSLPSPIGASKSPPVPEAEERRKSTSHGSTPARRSSGSGSHEDEYELAGPVPELRQTQQRNVMTDKLPPLVMPEEFQPTRTPAEPVPETALSFDVPDQFDEYVVKYGDTLSGIALKMLGAQSRYLQIYEANRDRMSSPDRLDVGKPLRIPRVAGNAPKVY
jgi:nucleoid-associated protein YgaU